MKSKVQNNLIIIGLIILLCSMTAQTASTIVQVIHGGTGQTTYTKGDLLAAGGSSTLNKQAVGSNGQVLTADSTQTNKIKWATLPNMLGGQAFYGDASDGNAVIDGFNSFDWMDSVEGDGVHFEMNRPVFLDHLTVNSGTVLNTEGFILFAHTITVNGAITCDGGIGGGIDQEGPDGSSIGGGSWITGTAHAGVGVTSLGGSGGHGGTDSTTTKVGGAGGTVNSSISVSQRNAYHTWLVYSTLLTATNNLLKGGGGGGAGGDVTEGTGGGGAGGALIIFAKTITGSGSLTSNGGPGANSTSGTAGGAGGGGGGVVVVVTDTATSVTMTATGGAGGTGQGGAQNGSAGSNGTTLNLLNR